MSFYYRRNVNTGKNYITVLMKITFVFISIFQVQCKNEYIEIIQRLHDNNTKIYLLTLLKQRKRIKAVNACAGVCM